jgi:anti-sigma factor RsiW
MNCMDFEKRIMDYVEGTLDSVLTHTMREHIDSCADCAKMAEAHRVIFESLNDSEQFKAPAGLAASILSAVNADAPDNVIDFKPATNPVDCGVFEDNIAAFTDGLLDRELSDNMDTHRAACTSCGNLAQAHDLVIASLTSAEPVKAPAGLAARILTAVEEESSVTEKSFGIVKLFRKYGAISTISAAAGSLAAASVIIIGSLASALNSEGIIPESMSALVSQITAVPYLMQAWAVGLIPAEFWPHINVLLESVDIPYIGTSLPVFAIGAFFLIAASSTIYFSTSRTSYSPSFSIDVPV